MILGLAGDKGSACNLKLYRQYVDIHPGDSMASIELRQLCKTYDNSFQAVRGIDLAIRDREFMVLVGPSGCGKTTSLRMIAGLEDATSGDLMIGDRRVNDVEPKDRDIAMVFQSYALYPHMTVRENMAFALRLRNLAATEIERRVTEASRMLTLDALLDRLPKQLSGGQRQRVALGRAVVRNPQAFLFDEPLSNLDAKLRAETRAELRDLHRRLAATMLYVTHDQVEAMTLATRIAVMNRGVIEQVGPPQEIYDRPASLFVAGFTGSPPMNLISGEIVAREGQAIFQPDGGGPALPLPEACRPGKIILGIRPEDVSDPLSLPEISRWIPHILPLRMEATGADTHVTFAWGEARITGRFKPAVTEKNVVPVALDLAKLSLFDPATGLRI